MMGAENKKTSRTRKKLEGGCRGVQGVWGVQGVPGKVQGGQRFWAEKRLKTEKRSGTVWLACYAATSRILCRRFLFWV